MKKCPCDGCYAPKRTMYCHSHCTEYDEWHKEHRKTKEIEKKEKQRFNTLSHEAVRAIWRKMGGK